MIKWLTVKRQGCGGREQRLSLPADQSSLRLCPVGVSCGILVPFLAGSVCSTQSCRFFRFMEARAPLVCCSFLRSSQASFFCSVAIASLQTVPLQTCSHNYEPCRHRAGTRLSFGHSLTLHFSNPSYSRRNLCVSPLETVWLVGSALNL